jgi:hypothetical protein
MPIAKDVQLGRDVRIFHPDLVNLYGCSVGDDTRIGTFVEIQIGAKIGARCKISSHSFICEGVTIEDEVFIGHGVMFTNDKYPRATTADGKLQGPDDWKVERTHIGRGRGRRRSYRWRRRGGDKGRSAAGGCRWRTRASSRTAPCGRPSCRPLIKD